MFKKGYLTKLRKSGELKSRFCVLIAKKLFVFIDQTSYFPSHVVYLEDYDICYDGNISVVLRCNGQNDDENKHSNTKNQQQSQRKRFVFKFESMSLAGSWANAFEDAKDYVPRAQDEEELSEEIFHRSSVLDDDDDDDEAAAEEGFDESVSKKQAFAFWGVDVEK